MESANVPPVEDAKPVRKRSRRERIIVWTGISVLLVIVAIEWTSLRLFQSSLSRLEQAIATPSPSGRRIGIPRDEIENHIDGITFRNLKIRYFKPLTFLEDEVPEVQHELMFRWPSLFKKYQLIVTVNSFDRAILVAADVPNESGLMSGIGRGPQ
ncbi:hypothetical protein [Schlesneria paludicola]|uniref:hypothetical protein n=1 Tax=Schlesneria paludicola TaxID=360056 RepID=UPI00029A65BC|nr:hypothetical protein [Schlesneria paludicola]